VMWAVSQTIIGVRYYIDSENSNNILPLIILLAWGLRLAGFLFFYRILHAHVDPRYVELSTRAKINKNIYFFIQFELQGVFLTLTSITLFYVFRQDEIMILNYVGLLCSLIGIIGESVADFQIQNFKNERQNNSEIFKGGLYRKARHPNLFFELVFWFGLAIYSINFSDFNSFYAFVGPFLLWCIMYFLTIPVTTKHMLKSKPDYKERIENSNIFIPF
jgi:steroid 5-alpha reductase family enzyme